MTSDSAGVRISGTVDDSGTLSLELMLQEEPEPTDEVSNQEGIRVFLAPDVSEPLSEFELDVAEEEDGARLQLQEQGSSA